MKTNKIIATIIFLMFIINLILSTIVLATESNTIENKEKLTDEIELNEDLEKDIDESKEEDNNINEQDEKNNDEELKNENSDENKEKKEELEDYKEGKKIEHKEVLEEKNETNVSESIEKVSKVKYSSHIQSYGWEEDFSKTDGEISGTEGQSKRIEAIKIKLGNSEEILKNSGIKYQVHAQDYGWMSWEKDGGIAGTIGETKRIEAVRIKLENLDGYSVVYRTHVENIGWTDWVNNGEVSGTEGRGLRIEAIQIKIVNNPQMNINCTYNEEKNIVTATVISNKEIKGIIDDKDWKISEDKLSCYKEYDINDTYSVTIKDIDNIERKLDFEITQVIEPISKIKYYSYINESGWEKKYSKRDGDISGIENNGERIEAIRIELGKSEEIPAGAIVKYQVHVQDYGWMNWRQNGEIAGTTNENKRIEAIKINIEGIEGYLLEYRTYIEATGWQKWASDGEISGTTGEGKSIEAIQIRIVKEEDRIVEPAVKYQAHVQNIGWQKEINENNIAGTTGKNYGIEALKIEVQGLSENAIIKYKAHISNYGWQDWRKNGEEAGTTGQSKSIEAIKIEIENLEGFSVEYRVNISGYGWQKWRKNGEEAGTTGFSKKIEAIQIRVVYNDSILLEPELSYKAHVQSIGWQNNISEGFTAGTEGKNLRVEALKINLVDVDSNAKIKYRTHIQDIGWQGWRTNGSSSGTEGQSKRIEAIQILLEGLDEYTIEYKVHIQNIGWSDWMIDGETAGTVGQSKRIEAIQIRLVPKYYRRYNGIDVSEFNGIINWTAVKNSGIQFAMIRCGYRGYRTGKIIEDAQFKNNIKGASQNGIKVGLYFFSQATSIGEAIEEANYTTNLARQYNCITYPLAIDTEASGADNYDGRADGLNTALRTNIMVAFCNQIKNNNYIPMIYASRDWFYNNLEVSKLSNYETWLAHYTGSPDKRSNYKYAYTMWQYTSSGSVYGINVNVDMNVGYKKY